MKREYLGTSLPDLWEMGAKELEETTLGRIITSPVWVSDVVIKATVGTVGALPGIVKTVPFILLLLAGGVAAYLVFMGKKGSRVI